MTTSKIRVAINGFGRIGRAFFKLAYMHDDIEVVAINDLGSRESLSYLLQYDTVYRTWDHKVTHTDGAIIVDGDCTVRYISEKESTKLPWRELGIDIVVESTGLFTSYEKSKFHLDQGARAVVISAPAKDEAGASQSATTILMGINEHDFGTCPITSNASCTTNAASPLIAILDEGLGIEKAILNTVHGYTASQSLVDGPSKKDLREGRAAAQNIVPSSTGAAIAVTQAFTKLAGKFDGISMRVPVPAGSMVDITFIAQRPTSTEEINELMVRASQDPRWASIFSVTNEPLVSSDILGSPFASFADLTLTRVVDGNLVKVMAWYDNEMGYTHTLLQHVIKSAQALQ